MSHRAPHVGALCFGSSVTEQADFSFWLERSTAWSRSPTLCVLCAAETEAAVVVHSLGSQRRRSSSSSHEWVEVFFEMKMRLRFDDAWACYFTFSLLQM